MTLGLPFLTAVCTPRAVKPRLAERHASGITAETRLRAVLFSVVAALTLCATAEASPPLRFLSETGLFVAGSNEEISPGVLSFSPQYPLWSDGTTKRRWISLPPGSSIDASRPDALEFPVGTRLWKEFSLGGRIETRMIERLRDGSWRFVVYVWRADGSAAELAPPEGLRALPVADAPNGRYVVPSQNDCRTCHEGSTTPVLGFSTLQLSPDRDPHAAHAEKKSASDVDLRVLAARGLLRNLPKALLENPPRIKATSADERAALGYLHANCGHCHSDPGETDGSVPVELLLAQSVTRPENVETVRQSLLGPQNRERAKALLARMRSRDPRVQMPPLGTQLPDSIALSLIEHWMNHDLKIAQEKSK